MHEWLLLLGAGAASTGHCVGMCGPIVVSIGAAAPSPGWNALRQLAHAGGRIFTYMWLGAVAGFGGSKIAGRWGDFVNMQAIIGVVAGVLLVYQGLRSVGLLPGVLAGEWTACSTPGLGWLFRAGNVRESFLAGIATGFLPCGLVWAFLGVAAAAGDPVHGSAVMLALGIGTIPGMMAAGCGAAYLTCRWRSRLQLIAGCCLLAAGEITLTRGVRALTLPTTIGPAECPIHATALKETSGRAVAA